MIDTDYDVPEGPITLDIKKSIEQAIAVIPDGKTLAVVAVATEKGLSSTLAYKIGDYWQIDAEVEKKWAGPVTGSVKVMFAW